MNVRIIDLLSLKSKENQQPYKIKYNGDTYFYDGYDYFSTTNGYLFEKYNAITILNDEVEVLEETEGKKKIPEKLPIGLKATLENEVHNTLIIGDLQYELNEKEEMICKKIHEIIDYLQSKGE